MCVDATLTTAATAATTARRTVHGRATGIATRLLDGGLLAGAAIFDDDDN